MLVTALRVAPDHVDAMFNLAALLQRINQYAEAKIGRELRKLYPPADTPSGLHALFTEERQRASAMNHNQSEDGKKDPNPK